MQDRAADHRHSEISMKSHPVSTPPLAYLNREFLESDDGRALRILAEYLQPSHALRRGGVHDTIVFFGSARITEDGPLAHYYSAARELARRLTEWSKGLSPHLHRYIVCTGGGPGIMEAANRGASDAHGRTVGLNIGLPHEQQPNPYITRELSFEFHYFFMRKLWFAHLARGLVVFPGGFGTFDELFEILTLTQTLKLERRIPILLYGPEYWNEIVNFPAMVRWGVIAPEDVDLFRIVSTPTEAFEALEASLRPDSDAATPAFAKSAVPSGAEGSSPPSNPPASS
jgi:uncharacterized protein (TIGR00730 family)